MLQVGIELDLGLGQVRRCGSRPLVPAFGEGEKARSVEGGGHPQFGSRHLEPLLDGMRRHSEFERYLFGGLVQQPAPQARFLIFGEPRERRPRLIVQCCFGRVMHIRMRS